MHPPSPKDVLCPPFFEPRLLRDELWRSLQPKSSDMLWEPPLWHPSDFRVVSTGLGHMTDEHTDTPFHMSLDWLYGYISGARYTTWKDGRNCCHNIYAQVDRPSDLVHHSTSDYTLSDFIEDKVERSPPVNIASTEIRSHYKFTEAHSRLSNFHSLKTFWDSVCYDLWALSFFTNQSPNFHNFPILLKIWYPFMEIEIACRWEAFLLDVVAAAHLLSLNFSKRPRPQQT